MCCLEGCALPVPAGAMAPGSLLCDLQPGSLFSFGCLGSLRSSFPNAQLALQLGEFMMSVMETLSFYFPPKINPLNFM